MAAEVLCQLTDIPAGGTLRIDLDERGLESLVLLRRGPQVYAYRNRCPHARLSLDFQPGRFVQPDEMLIQCANHGAQFRVRDGYCVAGPCAGDRLTKATIECRDGHVYLLGA